MSHFERGPSSGVHPGVCQSHELGRVQGQPTDRLRFRNEDKDVSEPSRKDKDVSEPSRKASDGSSELVAGDQAPFPLLCT